MHKGFKRFLTLLLVGGMIVWIAVLLMTENDVNTLADRIVTANLSLVFWNVLMMLLCPVLPPYFYED